MRARTRAAGSRTAATSLAYTCRPRSRLSTHRQSGDHTSHRSPSQAGDNRRRRRDPRIARRRSTGRRSSPSTAERASALSQRWRKTTRQFWARKATHGDVLYRLCCRTGSQSPRRTNARKDADSVAAPLSLFDPLPRARPRARRALPPFLRGPMRSDSTQEERPMSAPRRTPRTSTRHRCGAACFDR